ncbi:unnamed protein product [Trichobilharzia szidati]|nr:unnamed protein product [Trichobilharzia szidati]
MSFSWHLGEKSPREMSTVSHNPLHITHSPTIRKSLDPSITLTDSSVTQNSDECIVKMTKYDKDQFLKRSFDLLFQNAIKTEEDDKCKMRNLLRQTPLDMLSMEWLNSEPRTIEARAYLIGNLLPQVVLGLEFILKEACQRNLITNDILDETNYHAGLDRNFNPINRLAEYLMRNNHKYHHFNESSPYVRGLRNTVAKLQNEMFMRSENQLAKLKLTADVKRAEAKQKQLQLEEEYNRRTEMLSSIYDSFISAKKNSVDANVVYDIIYTFSELIYKLPEEMKQCLVPIFQTSITEDYGKLYDREQFVKYLMIYVKPMSNDVYEQFVEHLKLCSIEFHKAEEREERRKLIKKYFISCDLDQVDEISRDKVFQLCEIYFDTSQQALKQMIRNPKDWVTREYHLRLPSKEMTAKKESIETLPTSKSVNDNNAEERKEISIDNEINNSADEILQENMNKFSQLGSRQLDDIYINQVQCKIEETLSDRPIEMNSLTQSQFISLMEFFIPENVPINILHQYLKVFHKYTETTEERDERKQQHFQKMAKLRKDQLMEKIFYTMSQNFSGMLNLKAFENYLLDYEDGFYEAHLKHAKSDLASVLQLSSSKHSSQQSTIQTTSSSYVSSSLTPSSEQFNSQSNFHSSSDQSSYLYLHYPKTLVEININDFKALLNDIFWPKNDPYLSSHDEFDLNCLEKLLDYLKEKLVQNISDKIKSEVRREWIQNIINTAKISYNNSMETVYKAVFQTLIKDTLRHGEQKQITAKIAILSPTTNEKFTLDTDIQSSLQYVAAIPVEEAEKVIGKCPQKTQSDLLIQCLRTGSTLIHPELLDVRKYSHLNKEEYSSSSICSEVNSNSNDQPLPFALAIPIPTPKKYFIGVIEVNNLSDSVEVPKFEEHEIQFYRGIACQIGFAFSLINTRYLFTSMLKYAFDWISERLVNIDQIVFYHQHFSIDENNISDTSVRMDSMNESVHRQMLYRLVSKYGMQKAVIHTDPKVINRKDNYLYYYLFDVAESKYTMQYCILDNELIGILDICCSDVLNKDQVDYLHETLKVLQDSYAELVNYTGVSTCGQCKYSWVAEEEEENEEDKRGAKKRQLLMNFDNNKFIPQRIQKSLINMELNFLTLRMNENLLNDIGKYEIQLTDSEIYLLWTMIILLYPDREYDPINERSSVKQLLDSIKDDFHLSITEYDPFVHEKEINGSRQTQLNECFEKISHEELDQYACQSMKFLYQWLKLCIFIVNGKLST